ncbi:ATP-binding cassette domain-containing protein [Aquimarina sp. D1M17]|uniref:sulfate/molybdate ABC transporter ATP-binding protein n=1 Tax=Aquimarina acroporae TaxID=2937283 RepID=UPI0020BD7B84|nr:ATP-binding cassette domain-containing protein [Aquimarina acroporae]MCK8521591.1 ATP-binding cassette domain-containing protein [Aquimarina acroporae]
MIHCSLQKKLLAPFGEMLLDIDLKIEKGELVTLYGESGAGKTSIFRMLAGLLIPDSGLIKVGEKFWLDTLNSVNLKPQQRNVGFVFQDYALFPNMSVRENLLFALPKGKNKQIIKDLIEIVELGDLQDRKPENLSGGQKQRVALARALVQKPQVLMLDEPLSSLDAKMRIKLQNYILQVHREFNLTTLLISHEIGEVIKMCDRVFLIERGKISKQGKPINVFSNKQISGKFQFVGEVVHVEREEVISVVTVLIGTNFIKVVVSHEEAEVLQNGDKVLVASKAFNPVLQKVN